MGDQKSPLINIPQLIHKVSKNVQDKTVFFLQMMLRKPVSHVMYKDFLFSFFTLYKSKLTTEQRPKWKTTNFEAARRKVRRNILKHWRTK